MADDVRWEGAPGRRASPAARGVSRWVVGLVVVGAFAVGALLLTGPRPRGEALAEVPAEVMGRWRADDPRYAGAGLVFGRDYVELRFVADSLGSARHAVADVRTWEADGKRVYRVEYDTDEGRRSVDVVPAGDGTLRLANPADVVWRRVP